jgi:integrase
VPYDPSTYTRESAPAARQRPGAGTEERSFDARATLPGEALEMSRFVPIPEHRGFYRRDGQVMFRFRDRRGRRRWAGARTIKEAQRRKVELELDVRRGDFREPSQERFSSYARAWIETYAGRTSRGIQEHTRTDYRRRIEREAIEFFGEMKLEEISPRDVKEYALWLAQRMSARSGRPVKPDTVRLGIAPVRALLASAAEEGVIRANPANGLRLSVARAPLEDGEEEQQVKALSEQELAALLAALPEEWRLFFSFLALTGTRIGEAIETRWRDVDLGRRTLHVRRRFYRGRVGPPKSKYGRRQLRLTPALASALWRLRGAAGDDELVFTAELGARIDQSNLMSRVLKPAAVEAGLGQWVKDPKARGGRRAETWVGFHSLRHTCATVLFRHGWNAVQVQRWLGHHAPSFTLDRYVHLLDADVPEPAFFDAIGAACDQLVTRDRRNRPKEDEDAAPAAMRLSLPSGELSPGQPKPAEVAAASS